MAFSTRLSSVRSAHSASRFVARLTAVLVFAAAGCADGGQLDDSFDPSLGVDSSVIDAGQVGYDAGGYPVVDAGGSLPAYDAGQLPVADAGGAASDAGKGPSSDAGSASSDAGASKDAGSASSDAGGGIMIPDLFGDGGFKIPDLFPASDAGTSAPSTDGGRDVNGPCKDLNLICFDFIDMWINAECQTCNGGKGCQGCNIPFAY